ncbi:carboxysome shell carbonic anhydrase, partial [Arthrospira platensis SPKY1]|nr:carboxysome shell carbonic anhydrase [Arthrospira platensis SPKY1]
MDRELNATLERYERQLRGRFEAIESVLRQLSARQHELDFAEAAQHMARERLGFEWPQAVLECAWVNGVDMPTLHANAIFQTIAR